MTRVFIILILIFSLSCEKKFNSQTKLSEISSQTTKEYKTCEEALFDLVKSSNAGSVKRFEDLQVRIESKSNNKLVIELYVTNDISEDPNVKRMTDQSIGWLEFIPSDDKLLDITYDPENPITLTYDKSILKNTNFNKLCSFTNDSSKVSSIIKKCKTKDIPEEYIFKDICEYDNIIDLNILYKDYTKSNSLTSDLLENLPRKDTLYSTSTIQEIKYIIKKNLAEVYIQFEGGRAELKIYNTKNKGIVEVTKNVD